MIGKIKTPDDFRPGTKKGKLDRKPIWIVEIQMPKKVAFDMYKGYMDKMRGDTEKMENQGAPTTGALPQGAPAPVAPMAMPAAAPVASAAPVAPVAETPVASNLIEIRSPMIGTFYRSASPEKPAFVEVGSEIKVGDKVCIVEAMKLFNDIESEVSGRIVKILVNDMSPIEFDQPLFLVEPA